MKPAANKVDPIAMVWLEGLGELKSPMTSSGVKPGKLPDYRT
jgi:hypothetical protein